MRVRQYDIEEAFLNGPLEEELYVWDIHATGHRAWRLRKSLYGTKQAAYNWNKVLNNIFKGLGFSQCFDNPGLYYRISDRSIIVVHVDDLLCAFPDLRTEKEWEAGMSKHLTLEKRRQPQRFLGMDWSWHDRENNKQEVLISGALTIEKLAQDYGIGFTREATTLYTTRKEPEGQADIKQFQKLTGKLLFITQMWRLDIRYAVQRLCVKTRAPTSQDWINGLKIVAYLYSTKNEGIMLGPSGKEPIDIFTDAGEERLEDKATSGILTRIGMSPVSWASRKQDVVTLSSTEAEYIALSMGVQDELWLQKVLEFLGEVRTPRIWTDNRGASILTENPDFHRRTKHI